MTRWGLIPVLAAALLCGSAVATDCDSLPHIGAGILPYAIDEAGAIHLLLGFQKERGWTSFGGSPERVVSVQDPRPRCETPRETALRETMEELRYLVPRAQLLDGLENAPFYSNVTSGRGFLTYVVRIPYLDLGPFRSTPVLYGTSQEEMEEVAWFPLSALMEARFDLPGKVPTPNHAPLWDVFWAPLAGILQESPQDFFPLPEPSNSH